MVDQTSESKAEHLRMLERSIEIIRSSCRIAGALPLAYLDPEERKALVTRFGNHGAQSIMLATPPGFILWTDDQILALVAKQRFGVRRIWTQVALQWRAKEGTVDPALFYDATCRLFGWEYFFTSPNTPALLRAVEIAKSNPTSWPLHQGLRLLTSEAIAVRDAAGLAADFILSLYRQSREFQANTAILVALLERLSSRADGGVIIRSIRNATPIMFGVDLIACDEVIETMDAWLAGKKIVVAN
jgi:hypothetical protein